MKIKLKGGRKIKKKVCLYCNCKWSNSKEQVAINSTYVVKRSYDRQNRNQGTGGRYYQYDAAAGGGNRGYSNNNSGRTAWTTNKNVTQQERKKKRDDFDYSDKNWKDYIKQPEKDKRQKTEDVTNTKGSLFDEFTLKKELLRGILESGFDKPSPIQEAAIPSVLSKQCILARAKNGTGKTGAYTIPVLQRVESSKKYTQAVILVPTRELALQTSKVVMDIGRHLNLNVACVTGGTNLQQDVLRS
ncbi:DEAD box ATP-dependent RNA helicase, partial [Reticulomyxa filosa]